MSKDKIKGFKHECGHYCASPNKKHCCRCQNPKNGYYWPPPSLICKICWGTMKKYGDGSYFQKCPHCGRVVKSVYKGSPILAPLASCGCEETKEKDPLLYKSIQKRKEHLKKNPRG